MSDEDGFRKVLQTVVQEALEAEMTKAIGAEKGERTAERVGYGTGYYERKLVTRVWVWNFAFRKIGPVGSRRNCLNAISARRRRGVGVGGDVRAGLSTRKVKAITEELCGHAFSASTVSEATVRLDEALKAFCTQRLEESYPYLILDARYERAREAGVIASQAVLVAIGVDWEGRRQVLGVELANRESHSSWRVRDRAQESRARRRRVRMAPRFQRVLATPSKRRDRKNDQAHVEQKNGAIVRPLVGYGRFVAMDATSALARLYAVVRPDSICSVIQVAGEDTDRRYLPVPPAARVLAQPKVAENDKERLRASMRKSRSRWSRASPRT